MFSSSVIVALNLFKRIFPLHATSCLLKLPKILTENVDKEKREEDKIYKIHQTQKFIELHRKKVEFHPSSFIEGKTNGRPPISFYLSELYDSILQLDNSIMEFSVLTSQDSAIIGFSKDDDEIDSKGHAIFSSSSWMPGRNITAKQSTNDGKQRKMMRRPSSEEASVESESPPKKKRKCKEKNEKIGQGEEEEKQETKKLETTS